jgi:hypothetical protein
VFGLGRDDKGISTLDTDGVSLAAIQGLFEELKARDEEIKALKDQMRDIQERLKHLPPAP